MRLRLELFGGLVARVADRSVCRFRTEKTGALLAYLGYYPQAHRRADLIERFWPECPENAGRNSLSTALWALRHDLAPLGIQPEEILHADRNSVWLEATRIETDVAEFQTACARARAAPPPVRCEELRRVVALYQGELLHGYSAEWLVPEQVRLAAQQDACLRELLDLLEERREWETAIELAARAISFNPLSEQEHARLCRLYLAAGRPALALQHYREMARVLQHELGRLPSAESEALLQAIREAQAGDTPRAETGWFVPVPSPAVRVAEPDSRVVLESLGGAVPLDSPFYVRRTVDAELERALARRESLVLIKGPRQTGKTSLLARGLQEARRQGAGVVFTDLQTLSAAQLSSLDGVLQALAGSLAEQLELNTFPRDTWDAQFGPNQNLRRYLRREVLTNPSTPLVWALDEVDRLFTYPYASEVFGLFRSWHNERALDPNGPWSRLSLALTYATEAHLFVTDLNQSPFNVGLRLEVGDFEPAQVADLAVRYGLSSLSPSELAALMGLLGGHPYLIRRAFHEISHHGLTVGAILRMADEGSGIFQDHLQRLATALGQDPELCATVDQLLARGAPPPEGHFYRLRSAGILAGLAPRDARFRCQLDAAYLRRRLARDGCPPMS